MKKFSFLLLLACSLILSGCSVLGYGDILHDSAKMADVQKEIKEKANGAKIFQAITFKEKNYIEFEIQNTTNKENVDRCTYQPLIEFLPVPALWSGPSPIKLKKMGGGDTPITAADITKRSWDLDSVDLKVIPKVVADAEKKAAELGLKDLKMANTTIDKDTIAVTLITDKGSFNYFAKVDGTFRSISDPTKKGSPVIPSIKK